MSFLFRSCSSLLANRRKKYSCLSVRQSLWLCRERPRGRKRNLTGDMCVARSERPCRAHALRAHVLSADVMSANTLSVQDLNADALVHGMDASARLSSMQCASLGRPTMHRSWPVLCQHTDDRLSSDVTCYGCRPPLEQQSSTCAACAACADAALVPLESSCSR